MHRIRSQSLERAAVGRNVAAPGDAAAAGRRRATSGALDRGLARAVLALAGRPAVRIALWDGTEIGPGGSEVAGRLVVRDRAALLRLALDPERAFGDLYSAGRVVIEGDLVAFLEIVYRAIEADYRRAPWRRTLARTRLPRRANTPRRARQAIRHHYDLGNDFYALWLDADSMQYTCAYYPQPDLTLEQAQAAKMHHICRKLGLRRGESVIEAGCGWGGLALFMARCYGVRVRAWNLSAEQVAWARGAAAHQGLSDRVEFVQDDYRNIGGQCDAFVSVGMLEHVGQAHYAELGAVIDRCLAPHGRGLLHTIGRNRPGRLNAWIERRIFPGGFPPTLSQMAPVLEPHALSVLDVENLRLHYARTLRHWLERFERERPRIEAMFDARFVRAWRLYLAGSVAAFSTGSLQLFQVVFARPSLNDLPWSRAHLYR